MRKEMDTNSAASLEAQRLYMGQVRELNARLQKEDGRKRLARVETFGCQQNNADSDKIRGMLCEMGYGLAEDRKSADLILFNTCAVREHAELRVFGNIGAVSKLKEQKPSLVVGVCGCMMQQEERAQEVMKKHRHVDLVFGTHALLRFPQRLWEVLSDGARVTDVCAEEDPIAEGLPVLRDSSFRAWVTVMYGCNNFCTYCIVPYLRGRERSRAPEAILEEIKELSREGYKEIMLLGQNVNSYGKDLETPVPFASLLQKIDEIPGDFTVQFMTSHPKDCSKALLDTMAGSKKIARRLHLPVQSGSNEVLRRMNRSYTVEAYLELLEYAREKMPDLTITSDLIVGFPGETEEDFTKTLELVERAHYDNIYTFLYSRRKHTPAAEMEGQIPKTVKNERLNRLMELQQGIAKEQNEKLVGKDITVLIEGTSKNASGMLTGKTSGGKSVHFEGDISLQGQVRHVRITKAQSYSLYGELLG